MKIKKYLGLFAALVLVALLGACKKDPVSPKTGTISGTVGVPNVFNAFILDPIPNARVGIYASLSDLQNDRHLKTATSSGTGAYTLSEVAPGAYYLDVWKDNDFSDDLSSGDYYGYVGSTEPVTLTVTAGQTATLNIRLEVWP